MQSFAIRRVLIKDRRLESSKRRYPSHKSDGYLRPKPGHGALIKGGTKWSDCDLAKLLGRVIASLGGEILPRKACHVVLRLNHTAEHVIHEERVTVARWSARSPLSQPPAGYCRVLRHSHANCRLVRNCNDRPGCARCGITPPPRYADCRSERLSSLLVIHSRLRMLRIAERKGRVTPYQPDAFIADLVL